MPTNTDIVQAFYTQVRAFATANNYSNIVWTASSEDQDGKSKWIEVNWQPNDTDPFLSEQSNIKQGFFTLTLVIRPNKRAEVELLAFEDLVQAEWPKTTTISGTVQVTATPSIIGEITNRKTAMAVAVSIPYEE